MIKRLLRQAIFLFGCIFVIIGIVNWSISLAQRNRNVIDTKSYQDLFDSIEKENINREEHLNNLNVNFKDQNSDYIFWLNILNTEIEYPVVKGSNNQFYLTHNFKGENDPYGAIFVDYRNEQIEVENQIVIYGHSALKTAMFGKLIEFKNLEYFDNHSIIEITTENMILTYKVFAVEIVDANEIEIKLPLNDLKLYLNALKQNALRFEDIPDTVNRIITLVSCEDTYENGRILVHAYMQE